MKYLLTCMLLIPFWIHAQKKYQEGKWLNLLDESLTHWEKYLAYPNKNTFIADWPKDDDGNYLKPLGINNDITNVFTVTKIDGEPVLHITGEIYGCIATKNEFENYHLKAQIKWGTLKWEPRLDQEKDSGILYHSIGEYGVDYWRTWMLSEELQIIEGGFGDYWSIAGSEVDIKASKQSGDNNYIFDPQGEWISFDSDNNYCKRLEDVEIKNDWNTVELICFQDKSIHIVNGKVMMVLMNPRYNVGDSKRPLTKGKIQIQSEAAEVFYKGIQIKSISHIPKEYQSYFESN